MRFNCKKRQNEPIFGRKIVILHDLPQIMRRFFGTLALICALTVGLSAQSVQLQWLAVDTFRTDSDAMAVLTLKDGVYARCHQLPSLEVALPNDGAVTIENVAYATLSDNEKAVAQANIGAIPTEIAFEQLTQICRKQKSYVLQIFPFVKTNEGEIKKVVSFDIVQQPIKKNLQKSNETSAAARYASNSILRSGRFVKISVQENGLYRLTYDELKNMGIDPTKVRIFGYGGAMLNEDFSKEYIDDLPEVTIYEHKGADGVFGSGDYIIFYGQGPTSWKYSAAGFFRHTRNPYSNYGYYFVTSDAGTGRRIEMKEPLTATPTSDITTFTDYFVHEEDLRNLASSGREWYGEEFNSTKSSYTFQKTLPNIVAENAYFFIKTATNSATVDKMNVSVNGKLIGYQVLESMDKASIYERARTSLTTSPIKFTPDAGKACNVTLDYVSNASGMSWLDYFEVNIKRQLKIDGTNPLYFSNIDSTDYEIAQRYVVSGASASTQVWDITDQQNMVQMPTNYANGQVTFVDSMTTYHRYVALNPANATLLQPTIVGTIENQNLHGLPQMDLVILAPKEFLSEGERLAEAHRQAQGMAVQVVDVEQVYNEFSSGAKDATAYRRLMKLFYDRAASDDEMPRYLLLLGSGVYDNRKIVMKEDYDKLLTFQAYNSVHETESYVCDDYFALLDDNEGTSLPSEKMDIGVGRLPAHNLTEAQDMIDKTIGYIENREVGAWKNQHVFVADDGDNNIHTRCADSVANLTLRNYPDVLVRKLFLDSYNQEVSASGESYPLALEQFDNYIKNGSLVINYMGHAGHATWSNEGLLTYDRIVNMYNDRLPVFVTAACDFSRFDGNGDPSGGELMMRNNHGGAIALFTTTRTVYAEPNFLLNLQFARYMLMRDENGRPYCFGDVMRCAKNARSGDSNKMSFILIGDPAVELACPSTHAVVTDSIAMVNSGTKSDTIKALSRVRIYAHLEKEEQSGSIDESFNGYATINVFDKSEQVTTLNNDNPTGEKYTFTDRSNALFVGSSKVTDGRFTTEFIVPKDIRYNYGSGRIVYYAVDTMQNLEGNGYYESFTIGGEDANATPDDEGPEVTIYLNTPDFRSGDATNESPLFVAFVHDESGINAIGSGIGHDIMLKLDNDPQMETTLNNYYSTDMDEYRSGEVRYQFSDLEEGKHHLFFRVWDLQNNSSTAELDFVVKKGLNPSVSNIYLYPNPASSQVTFVYTHDRPEQPLKMSVTVADLMGKVVYTGSQSAYVYDNQTEMTWNFAGQLNTGMYVVRIGIQVEGGETTSKTLKLMVVK